MVFKLAGLVPTPPIENDTLADVPDKDDSTTLVNVAPSVPGMGAGPAGPGDTVTEGGKCFCIVPPTVPPATTPTIPAKQTRVMTALPLVVRQNGLVLE